MSTPAVILTNITPPRVSLTDPKTGLISREWYRFFFSLFQLTGGGSNYTSILDLQVGPDVSALITALEVSIATLENAISAQPVNTNSELQQLVDALAQRLDSLDNNQSAELQQQINTLEQEFNLFPRNELGTISTYNSAAPVSGGIAYGANSAYAFSAVGTAGQVLTSAGAGAPTWTTSTTGTVTSVSGTGTVNGITLTGTVTSSGSLTLGGTLSGVNLTTQVSGILPIANGGTNSIATATAGGIGYGTGTAHAYTAAGTTGQVLTSAGAGVPTWTTPTTGTVTSVGLAAPAMFTVSNSPVISSGTLTLSYSGTALPTTSGGTGLTAFTANGLLYASSTSALTTGSALTFDGTTLSTTGALRIDGNTTLGDAATDTVTVNGYVGVGGAGSSATGISIQGAALTGTSQTGVTVTTTGNVSATTRIRGFAAGLATTSSAFTVTDVADFWASDASKGAGSTITNLHGLYVADLTSGTNSYGVTSLVSSGANKWNIYASGTASNYFAGNVGIGASSPGEKLEVRGNIRVYDGTGSAFANIQHSGFEMSVGTSVGAAGFLTFKTGAGVERMRLDSAGNIQVSTGAVVVYAPTPAAISGAVTLTNANLQTQILSTTGTTYTVTMPLGTTLETLITWSAVNLGYDFTVVNTASGTITIGANGNTTLGSLTIATGTSAQFRIRRTAANAFTIYRIS